MWTCGKTERHINHSSRTTGATSLFRKNVPKKVIQGHWILNGLHQYENVCSNEKHVASNVLTDITNGCSYEQEVQQVLVSKQPFVPRKSVDTSTDTEKYARVSQVHMTSSSVESYPVQNSLRASCLSSIFRRESGTCNVNNAPNANSAINIGQPVQQQAFYEEDYSVFDELLRDSPNFEGHRCNSGILFYVYTTTTSLYPMASLPWFILDKPHATSQINHVQHTCVHPSTMLQVSK